MRMNLSSFFLSKVSHVSLNSKRIRASQTIKEILTFLWIINEELYRRVDTKILFSWLGYYTASLGEITLTLQEKGVIDWELFREYLNTLNFLWSGENYYCGVCSSIAGSHIHWHLLCFWQKDLLYYVFMYDIYPFSVHYAFSLAFFRVNSRKTMVSELLNNWAFEAVNISSQRRTSFQNFHYAFYFQQLLTV